MNDFHQELSDFTNMQEQGKAHLKQASDNVANAAAGIIRINRDQLPKGVESFILDMVMHYQDLVAYQTGQMDQHTQIIGRLFKQASELSRINQEHVDYSIQLANVLKEAGFDVGPIPTIEEREKFKGDSGRENTGQ